MNKIKDLNKETKQKVIAEYYKSKRGNNLNRILNRLVIEGILSLICAIIFLVSYLIKDLDWWYLFVIGALTIGGISFLLVQHSIRTKEINKFISENPKFQK